MIRPKFAEGAPLAVLSQVRVRQCRFARGGLEQLYADISCSSRSNWSRLRDLSARSCALTAFLSTFPHGFAFVFSALRRASRA